MYALAGRAQPRRRIFPRIKALPGLMLSAALAARCAAARGRALHRERARLRCACARAGRRAAGRAGQEWGRGRVDAAVGAAMWLRGSLLPTPAPASS